MSTPRDRPSAAGAPTVREIATLTARLRALTAAGPDADPAERAAFLADKAALLARIPPETTDREARVSDVGPIGAQAPYGGLPGVLPEAPHSRTFALPAGQGRVGDRMTIFTRRGDRTGDPTRPAPTPHAPQPARGGLPLPALVAHPPQDDTTVYVVTAVDVGGRLANAAPVRALGWAPGHPVLLHVLAGSVVIATPSAAGSAIRDEAGRRALITTVITGQGHLRLPATVRHGCRLEPGARLLVAAHPDAGVLVAVTVRALDGVVRAYVESLLAPDGGGGW